MSFDHERDRFEALPRREVLGHVVPVAASFRSRLLGLAGLSRAQAGPGLLIPRCGSVHTFGMRFDLDLIFLDGEDRALAVHLDVPPRRLVWHRTAVAVLEIPSAQGGEFGWRRDLGGQCCRSAKRSPASSSARTTR